VAGKKKLSAADLAACGDELERRTKGLSGKAYDQELQAAVRDLSRQYGPIEVTERERTTRRTTQVYTRERWLV
jgi:hypothetical protein